MADTTYQVFQDGAVYKVRITRLGNFIQEANGFESKEEAKAWIAQARRLAARDESKEPLAPPHLSVVRP